MNKTNASTTLATTMLVAASLGLGYALLPKAQTAHAASPAVAQQTNSPANVQQRARAAHAQMPVSFEINRGQFDPQVQFKSRSAGYTAFLTSSEAVFVLRNPEANTGTDTSLTNDTLAGKTRAERRSAIQGMKQEQAAARAAGRSVVRMSLVGANAAPQVVALDELPGKVNYFRGQNPSAWVTDVPTYGRVQFAGVYPGVDLVFYGKGRELEYDLVVAPGADARQIGMRFEGAERLEIDPMSGELVVHTPGGAQLRQGKPFIYQQVNGRQRSVSGGYAISGERVTFNVGDYDATAPLVIDPVIRSYASYLGGENDDRAHDVTVDADGNAYVVGWTQSETFPTKDATQPGNNNENDEAFVTKFNADGSGLVWSTYLGGGVGSIFFGEGIEFCGGEEGAYGVAVDSADNVYVTGYTFSRDFPTRNAMQPNLSEENCDGDSFITKLNPQGNQLVFSTYHGGVDGIDIGRGIAVDANQNVYVVGYTNSPFFPTTNPIQAEIDRRTIRTTGDTRFDAYLSKIDASGQTRAYSTYLGGDQDDVGLDVAVDAAGNAYVTGWTESTVPLPGPVGAFLPSALYASDGAGGFDSTLYILDPANGSVLQTVGSIGFPVTGLAFDGTTGGLYGSVNAGNQSNSLVVIDPATGAGTLIGSYVTARGVADITFDASGNLFGWAENSASGNGDDDLYSIDTATGFATRVGESGLSTSGSGLAFDAAGTLYLAGNSASGVLSIINPGTGQATAGPTLSGAPLPTRSISALSFGPDALYGANLNNQADRSAFLVTIDITNGNVTNRGPSVTGLTALAFAPAAAVTPPLSPASTPRLANFPTTAGVFQQVPAAAGTRDAFITKVNAAGTAFTYSTFLGGSDEDVAWSIAVGADGSAFVAGYTDSGAPIPPSSPTPSPAPQGFPTTSNAYQPQNNGGYDAFLTRINPAGSALLYSTYLGGDQDEGVGGGECLDCAARYDGAAVTLDFVGNAYVVGWTQSTFVASPSDPSPTPAPVNFPIKNAAQPQPGTEPGVVGTAARDAFAAKFNTDLAGDASLIYSTFLGGPEQDEGQGIAVDRATNAYITGFSAPQDVSSRPDPAAGAPGGPVLAAFPVTPGTFQETAAGGEDAFLVEIAGGGFIAASDGDGFIITGRVTRASDGAPLAGVTITLTRPDASTSSTTTNSDGVYFFEGLPTGTYTVTPSGGTDPYTPPSQAVEITNENERADFTAAPAASPSPSPSASPSPSPSASPTPTAASQPVNLSTRLQVLTGDRIGIGGFIITGSAPKRVLIRGLGPSLVRSVAEVLADPVLELRGDGGGLIATNNNWRDTQESQIEATGIPPTNDLEAAIDVTLDPGAYTALLSGIGDDPTGVGLVEVYDLDQAALSKLGNLSTRAFVGTGDNITIAGFVLGNNGGSDRVVVRGLGPSLTAQGVPDVLENPTLELRNGEGVLILSNNDWQDNPSQAAELTASGLAPTDPREAAVAATLPPGLYTALLAGLDETIGNGIVEIYDRGPAPAASPTPAAARRR